MAAQKSPSLGDQHPLSVGIVTETFPPEVNGVAATVQRFAAGLAARGHSVEVVRPHQPGRKDGNSGDRFATEWVTGLPLPGYRGLRFGLPAGRRLERRWGSNAPDILYVATEGPLGWSAVRWARRRRIPAVSGFHTNFHSYSSHYRLGMLRSAVLGYLRKIHNSSDCTLVPTRTVRDQLRALRFSNVEVLGRGVDSNLFSPERRSPGLRARWGARADTPVALYVGRLAPEKNLDLAFEAFEAMRRKDSRARMVVVGNGPLYERLSSRTPGIIFAGVKHGEELATHYASADIFLFPSVTETFGNVTLEALASGLAVLAFDCAAAGLLIDSGVNGWLVAPGDRAGFCTAATRLVRENGTELRRRARDTVLAHDWDRIIDGLERLFYRCSGGKCHGNGE